MEVNTKKRRNARRVFEELYGWLPIAISQGARPSERRTDRLGVSDYITREAGA